MADTKANTPDVKVDPKDAAKPATETDFPAAGPHARPELNDESKTPGAGMLSNPDPHETDAPGG